MPPFWQNLFVFFRAAPSLLRYAISGRWLTAGADEPAGEFQIPQDFFGLCVATSEDPACDDFIIERLKELGVRQVRLDFRSDSRTTFQERFLRRLIDEKFRVCLHLGQSYSEAESMQKSARAREDWRLFMVETLAAYGREVELIEIGSTCNRRKWSGYTLPGYLKTWQIACEAASAHNCVLAAPNVTDFEPFYNIALLSEMKRKNLLPAVHTDNLFVERATEPEAYDRKIAGRMFANMLRFNLIRKAWVLNDIALTFGVQKTICAHVSWSLRRIARFLGAVEEKQADYLARYCCLAAVSGALKRVYWGPLIGQREGLIDDGTLEFPEIPHVTFYGKTPGNINDYRIRPAYYAFQTANRFLSGSKYIRKIPSEHGLEIHEFRNAESLLHVAWTMNGRRVLAKDCYQAAMLKQAQCYARDGRALTNPPTMISESPLYIMWPEGDSLQNYAQAAAKQSKPRVLKNIRFANIAGRQYDFIARNDLAGVCLSGSADQIVNMFSSLKAAGQAGHDVLRDARNRVWRCVLPGKGGSPSGLSAIASPAAAEDMDLPAQEGKIVIKLFRPAGPFRRFLQMKKGDKALRSWNGAQELLRRGIPTPLPVAFFHYVKNSLAGESWYVCEDFAGSFSVRNAFTAFSNGAGEFEGVKTDELYDQIALFLREIHDRGVYFRDLSAGNLLFRLQKDKSVEFALIDTARALFYERSIGLRQRLCDLMRICHPLCWKGRKVFLAQYMAFIGRRYRAWMNIAFQYYDLKHLIKGKFRSVARLYTGTPRTP